jgi:hypothetical protein
MADARKYPLPRDEGGSEATDRGPRDGVPGGRSLKRARRPEAGRPSRGGSVLLQEGGAERAPTDREEVGDLASGSVSYPGKRSKTSLLARSSP